MKEILDLTELSLTFPTQPDPEIPRHDHVKWFHDRFTPDRKVIVVQGPDGIGKTNLLAQFAKAYCDRSISFFVKKDHWASDPQRFLVEMCTQMQAVIGSEDVPVEGTYYELKQLFGTLYHQLARRARRHQKSFYFVIDGLEWVPESYGEENIIDLLPHDPLNGTYLLASSAPGQDLGFAHDPWHMHMFSPTETEAYLSHFGIDKETSKRIYEVCEGMPGYLDQIRREILESGKSIEEILTDLPVGFQELLAREWNRLQIEDQCALDALAMLAHSQISLNLSTLAEITSSGEEQLKRCLSSVPFLQIDPADKTFHFVTDAHRHFVTGKLSARREWVEKALIEYHEQDPISESSLTQLPVLYKNAQRYNSLKSLVTVDYLNRALRRTHDMFVLRRNVQLVANSAHEKRDWQTLSKYSLMSSILRTLSTESAVGSEVDALLALGDYQQSLEISYQSVLPEDRLQLVAKICSYMKQRERPVPGEVLSDLERMVAEIDPKGSLRERVFEIAADLFYAYPQVAIELVEKVAGVDTTGRLMDTILAVLALRLEGDVADSVETLGTRIGDQSLRNFARASSPVVADYDPDRLIAEAKKIEDTSGKLFMLRSWCNANRENPEAIRVIDEAVEIMTASTGYSPSMRHLRQFAEPLNASDSGAVNQLIDRFDLLKDTAIQEPTEERTRLELQLASVEARQSFEEATNRLYRVYFGLDNIPELDTRCYCLVRILLSLQNIDPRDTQLQSEVEERLADEYQTLLNESAEHLGVTRRLLRALTNHDSEMAVQFARKLNTSNRRDLAFREILNVYTDQEPENIDLSFVEKVLAEISDAGRRDWTLVRVLKRFMDRDMFAHVPQARRFIERISEMADPRDRSFAYAYSLCMMASAGEEKPAKHLFSNMIEAWSIIDQKWQQVDIGFDLAAVIAETTPNLARDMLEKTRNERQTSPLAETTFAKLYIRTLELAIRAFSDSIKGKDYKEDRRKLIEAINRVPSLAVQSQLLADLAMRHHLASKERDFEDLVREHVLKLLESCGDAEARVQVIVRIAPCLFEYERTLMEEEVFRLSPSQQDEALGLVIKYLLSHRPPGDPVDLDSLNIKIDYIDALRICELLEQMNVDSTIYFYISSLVKRLVYQDRQDPQREKCVLVEKQAIRIAKRLSAIAETKFPQDENIQHKGYRIATQATIARLRAAILHSPHRAGEQWQRVTPSWEEIIQTARDVPNTADRAFVLALVGADMYRDAPNRGHNVLEEAKNDIYAIPDIIDRANRLQTLADAWKELDDKESAKLFLQEAMSVLQMWSWDQYRDQVTGQILQMAHSIDPEFAASLTSTVDNPFIRYDLENEAESRNLQHQPEKITDVEAVATEDIQHLLGSASWRLLRSFCSGKGYVQQERLVGQWTQLIIDARFEDTHRVLAWSVENDLARTKGRGAPALSELYTGLLDSLHMTWLISNVLLGLEAKGKDLQHSNPALLASLKLYSVGTREEAKAALQEWLRENAEEYVRIYDPYFTVDDLEILKSVPPDIRIHILTSWKAQKITPDDPAIIQRYQDTWAHISDTRPPETHIHVLGIKTTGDSPMHERYYITASGRGIEIGTSTGGLGKKDSYIRMLDPDEVALIEAERVNPMIVSPPLQFKGERLVVRTFTL